MTNKYNKGIENNIQKVKARLDKDKKIRKFIPYSSYPIARIRENVSDIIWDIFQIEKNGLADLRIELPPPYVEADFALTIFPLASLLKKSLPEIAKQIVNSVRDQNYGFIKEASNVGGYINISLDRKALYADILDSVNDLGGSYGESDLNAQKVVLIDYSSPNIAKPIGIGHLRSTIIGQALSNLYQATGFAAIRINHLGDWGTQFGSLIYAYQKWGDEKKMSKNPIEKLKNLYVKFNQEADKNPKLREEAKKIFNQLESGNDELTQLWGKFKNLSLSEFKKTYKKLGVSFDLYIGESYFVKEADDLIDNLLQKGICRAENAVVIVDSLDHLPSFLLRKNDGSSLYLTRDLATLKFRMDTFHPNVILYVVGTEQSLHFKQLLALAQKAEIIKPDTKVKHVDFGLMLKDGKKMSTRKGTVVNLEDVLKESISKSREILKEKSPDLDKKKLTEISHIVGVGAVIYNSLSQSRIRNIEFDWDRMMSFETGSAVYLQYTYVRIQSILRKSKIRQRLSLDKNSLDFIEPVEFELARKISLFPEIIVRAQLDDEANGVCTYLEELTALFNNFYAKVPVLQAENKKIANSRLYLINAVAITIENGLRLLNISVPEKM